MNAVAKVNDAGALIESVIVKGDLSGLSATERIAYYKAVCDSAGLNPLTKPFEFLTLNNKLVLYARKDATDQLRTIHNISVTDMEDVTRDGVYIVKVKVQNAVGRTDMAQGAVHVASLKGDVLANAFLKAETKAKRRATLSICGLGFLDETEIETIPGAAPANGNGKPSRWPAPRKQADISAHKQWREAECKEIQRHLEGISELSELHEYEEAKLTPPFMRRLGESQFAVQQWVEDCRKRLTPQEPAAQEEAPDPDTGELLPVGKDSFVANCNAIINEAADRKSALAWWNSDEQKAMRKKHLTPKERSEMQNRLLDRLAQLEVVA